MNFYEINGIPVNMDAVYLVAALHLYHIAVYYASLRHDDWLHHGLMIGLALPIGALIPSATLMGFNLFFTTGLPGGIDYLLLFLVRNGLLHRMTEKRMNKLLGLWIRSPGCLAHAAIASLYVLSNPGPTWLKSIGILPGLLTYWNGQYFLEQVISDIARREVLELTHEP